MDTLNWEEKQHLVRLCKAANDGGEEPGAALSDFIRRNSTRMDAQAIDMMTEAILIDPERIANNSEMYRALCDQYDRVNVSSLGFRTNVLIKSIKDHIAITPVQSLVNAAIFGYISAKNADTSQMDDYVICKKEDIDRLWSAAREVKNAGLAS